MSPEDGVASSELRVLVVCTANVCRSPVAERLLARHLAAAGHRARVRSAGTHGGRLVVHEHTVMAARDLEVDLSDHRSRLLSAALVATDGADLIVTMTREHLRAVVGIDPLAWPRSFTLKELARRTADVPRSVTDPREWISAAGSGRRAADMMTPSQLDDLDDPYGGPLRDHRAMVADVESLVGKLVAAMPSSPSTR